MTRRPPRLPALAYEDTRNLFSVNFVTNERRPGFAGADVAAAMAATIREHAAATNTPILAYCVMPDHVHILMAPSTTHSVTRFVGEVKNLAQRKAWALGVAGAFWEKSFFDHHLRESEAIDAEIDYIVDNPAVAGLATSAESHPFSFDSRIER